MKKIVSMMLAVFLVLSLSVTAFAADVPSKTTQDMTKVDSVKVENAVEGAAPVFNIVAQPETEPTPEYQEKLEACNQELTKIAASESVAAYFGEVKSADGTTVNITEILGSQDVKVHEFVPIEVADYDASYGALTVTVNCSQEYTKGDKVMVLVGIQKVNADGTVTIEWTAVECEVANGIQLTLTPELLVAIQGGTAMMTVLGK